MSLETDLQELRITALEISDFLEAPKDTTVREVVTHMRDENIPCALIVNEGKLVGIFTDKDVMHKVMGLPEVWDRPISELMTENPKTVASSSSAAEALQLMNEAGVRNMPVLNSDGSVLGNIGQKSFVRYLSDKFHMHIYNQPPAPDQHTKTRHGA